jgi:hypothetical protein
MSRRSRELGHELARGCGGTSFALHAVIFNQPHNSPLNKQPRPHIGSASVVSPDRLIVPVPQDGAAENQCSCGLGFSSSRSASDCALE